MLILVGLIEFKNGPFIRPHPAFWRAVLAIGVAYQMILVMILFQTKVQARYLFTFYDSSLGVRLPEKSYAADCSLTIANISEGIDIFVLAHVLGWVAKSLILRDYWICWVISILFELLEYSLEHQLPNFAECWWDHWILDVFTANFIGIFVGMKLCDYFAFKTYSWRQIDDIPTYRGKLARMTKQFTPHSYTPFDWQPTKSLKGFFAIVTIVALELLCEVNAFYLKYLLWIPVESNINVYRLILMFLMALPATREAYQFVNDPKCNRLGMHAWTFTMTVITELLIVIKFSDGEFNSPFPAYIIGFWTTFITLISLYAIVKFAILPRKWRSKMYLY